MKDSWFEGFDKASFAVNGTEIFARFGGAEDKPALLLLHGFPQTHAIWHRIAQQLKDDFYLVMPDLRGYGDSAKAPGEADHANYSKRTMAQDMVDLMAVLETPQFFVCGHDRGGRVAHRLAVDHPDAVRKLCLIDIAPTLDMYERADMTFGRYYYHWFHLIQPSPLPETMIGADPRMYVRAKLGGLSKGSTDYIEPRALAEYERCFSQPETIHAACEDYRASAGIDLEHDRASRAAGDKIRCDLLALWGQRGLIELLYKPLELWQAQCAGKVTGHPMPAGHFIPEELPAEIAAELRAFMR